MAQLYNFISNSKLGSGLTVYTIGGVSADSSISKMYEVIITLKVAFDPTVGLYIYSAINSYQNNINKMKSESITCCSPYLNSKCIPLDANNNSLGYHKVTRHSIVTKAFIEELRQFGKESDISHSSQSTYFISQKVLNLTKGKILI